MARMLNPVLLACALVACATATPYQPLHDGFGYSEQKLETNRYRVSFAGNSKTPVQAVEDYVLYRAAELTLANGYDFFVLSDRATTGEAAGSSGVHVGVGGFTFGSHSGLSIGLGTFTGSDKTAYQGMADVVMQRGKKPADNPNAFDAREIKANLEPSIVRVPAPGEPAPPR